MADYDPRARLAAIRNRKGTSGSSFSHFSPLAGVLLKNENPAPPKKDEKRANLPPFPEEPDFQKRDITPAKGLKWLKLSLAEAFAKLERNCPDYIDTPVWRRAVADGQQFMADWGKMAQELGWTAEEIFGLTPVPENPHPLFNRLARYDHKGLIWMLEGNEVIEITISCAKILYPTDAITTYRRFNKPAYGPVGDSLDDFI
jgi:hypothetical protein